MKLLIRIATIAAPLASMVGFAHANHGWADYHWARMAHPFPLIMNDSITADWEGQFLTAVNDWDQSQVLDLSVTPASEATKDRKQCRMVAGQIHVCNAAYGQNGWLGLATIGIDNQGHIDQGSAKMNDSYDWYFASYPNEKQHVICQEIGHDFGLGHTSEDGSSQNTCMDYSMSPTSLHPNQHDYDQILTQHHTNPYDDYNSYYESSSGGGSGGCNAPPGKGCNKFGAPIDAPSGVPAGAIRVDHNKFEEIWVKGRQDGGLWIFHVRLAPQRNGEK